MFPTSKLFSGTLCPDYTSCRLQPCLFNHSPPVAIVGVRAPEASTSALPQPARPGVPQKRPGAPANEGALKSSKTAAGGVPARPVASGSGTSSSSSRPTAAGPTSAARPPPPASTSYTARKPLVDTGPPRIAMVGATHSPFATRQKLLTAIYEQFLVTYASLPDQSRARILASQHAKAQEASLYSRSNKATYRNSLISALGRLKKRLPARTEEETGTLEDEAARLKAEEEATKGKLTREKVAKYVSSKELLRKYDYVVDLPSGIGGDAPTEEGNIRKCDRCGTEWRVKGELDEHDRKACSYHFGRMVTEKLGGVKQRVFSCCPAPGAVPCQQGPHVFRDDSIEALHSRIAFLPTTSLRSLSSSSLDIVALDCELVYTTSGMALARLTVISEDGSVVLDEHVRPAGSVLDTNLRFSGVKDEDIASAVLDVAGVREALGTFVGPETVIVGHGLENDLKALRLVHHAVIDTAIIYPHPRGVPWRHALRNLSRDVLGKFIQDGDPSLGHSSVDDSQAALELLRHKVKQDLR